MRTVCQTDDTPNWCRDVLILCVRFANFYFFLASATITGFSFLPFNVQYFLLFNTIFHFSFFRFYFVRSFVLKSNFRSHFICLYCTRTKYFVDKKRMKKNEKEQPALVECAERRKKGPDENKEKKRKEIERTYTEKLFATIWK